MKTVVGLFNSTSEAEQVKQELITDGYDADQLTVINDGSNSSYSGTGSTTGSSTETHRSVGEKIEHFFSHLMGGDDDVHEHYASGVNQGGALLAVRTEDADAEEVADWLDEHGARKIDRNARPVDNIGSSSYRDTAASGYAAASSTGYNDNVSSGNRDNLRDTSGTAAASGTAAGEYNADVLAARGDANAVSGNYNQQRTDSDYNRESYDSTRDRRTEQNRDEKTIPVVEEDLQVGKRTVDRGGVRVYSHVTEQPIDREVKLRDESINVERRTVDRPATAADFSANQGKVIEMYAQGEEAVVAKKGRVVEEVVVGKQVNERTENVHDNVRKTEVDVQKFDKKGDQGDAARDRDAASYTDNKVTDRR